MISFTHFMMHISLIYCGIILSLISQGLWKLTFLWVRNMCEGKSRSKLPYLIPLKQKFLLVRPLAGRYFQQCRKVASSLLENGDLTERLDKGSYPIPVGIKHGTFEHGQTACGRVWCKCHVNSSSVMSIHQVQKWCCDFPNGRVIVTDRGRIGHLST